MRFLKTLWAAAFLVTLCLLLISYSTFIGGYIPLPLIRNELIGSQFSFINETDSNNVTREIDASVEQPICTNSSNAMEEADKKHRIINDAASFLERYPNESAVLLELLKETLQTTFPAKTSHSLQVIIASTWRSGSTFLEQLLSSHSGTIDFYEPMMRYQLKHIEVDDKEAEEAKHFIHDLVNCKIDENIYISELKTNKDMLHRTGSYWKVCQRSTNNLLCYDKKFIEFACRLFPFMVVKLVRAGVDLLNPILYDIKLNPRIIFLVRDPRAVINSRTSNVYWCKDYNCGNVSKLCETMEKDLDGFLTMKKEFPGKIHLVRYEELALSPYNETRNLLQRLGWDYSTEIEKFLDTHTNSPEDKLVWSTNKDSKKEAIDWVDEIKKDQLDFVQNKCSLIMERLGYLKLVSLDRVSVEDLIGPLNLDLKVSS